ncbi:MAG TPA: glutamate-cysteine ligase family protein [Polyangia bacterium]|nr:glutamate-cysteine ligase family protein [Polyangia bacterium]
MVAHFEGGAKPTSALKIGVEHEKVGVLGDGRAPDYETIAKLLEAMATRNWNRVEEAGRLIALERPKCGTITLEPGGQLEHSGAPWPTVREAVRDNDKHIDELLPLAAALGVRFIGIGFRPFGTLDDVPWMPKGRYRVMRQYLPTRGAMAHEMMKRTTTVQANLDYESEADAMDKLRVSMGLSSLVTSLFAASPMIDGRVELTNGRAAWQSYRARAWLDTDNDRCGLLPFAFAATSRFRDYVEWALDVPLFFVKRDGEYKPAPGTTFRQFLAQGWQGERALPSDWELHLSTLFPEARLKTFVEVRQADASSRELVRALPALWRGVLYDATARHDAWKLVADWPLDERLRVYKATPRDGIHGTAHGRPMQAWCRELVSIARDGLARLGAGDEVALLAPLEKIAAEGRSLADGIAAEYQRVGGDTARMIDFLQLR